MMNMRGTVTNFRDEAITALEEIAKKYGFALTQTNINYQEDGSKFSAKFSFENNDEGKIEAKRMQEFNILCHRYGFKPTDYNLKVVDGRETMHLIGFKPRASVRPCVLISENNGKEYVAPVDWVKDHMRL